MFRRAFGAPIHRGAMRPGPPGVFHDKRRDLFGTLFAALAGFPAASAAAELVFEGGGQRMEAEVIDAAPMLRQAQVVLKFRLSEEASVAFGDFTGALLGQDLTISLCNQVLVEAVVQSRIDSGQGVITMIDDTTAEDMAAVLRGEADCSLLEPPLGN